MQLSHRVTAQYAFTARPECCTIHARHLSSSFQGVSTDPFIFCPKFLHRKKVKRTAFRYCKMVQFHTFWGSTTQWGDPTQELTLDHPRYPDQGTHVTVYDPAVLLPPLKIPSVFYVIRKHIKQDAQCWSVLIAAWCLSKMNGVFVSCALLWLSQINQSVKVSEPVNLSKHS